MISLNVATSPAWTQAALDNFDRFLVDHAACERKASATGMSFVVRYPDRAALLEPMVAFAREELEHYHQVLKIIQARGLALTPDEKDPYVDRLQRWVRDGRDQRLLDRLVLGAVVEARGCERFGMIRDALPEGDLKNFYAELTRCEARHAGLFLRLARPYFSEEQIDARLQSLLTLEGALVPSLELRGTLH